MVIPDGDDGCFGRECLHILMVSTCERLLACMTSLAVLLRLAYRLQMVQVLKWCSGLKVEISSAGPNSHFGASPKKVGEIIENWGFCHLSQQGTQ